MQEGMHVALWGVHLWVFHIFLLPCFDWLQYLLTVAGNPIQDRTWQDYVKCTAQRSLPAFWRIFRWWAFHLFVLPWCKFNLPISLQLLYGALMIAPPPPVGHCDTLTCTIRHCNDLPHVMLRPCNTTSAIRLDSIFVFQGVFVGGWLSL